MSVKKKFILTVKKVEFFWSSMVQTGRVLFRPLVKYGLDWKNRSSTYQEWVKTVSDWSSNSSDYFQRQR